MSRGNRFGKLLREVRKSEGWKLREVAERTGLSLSMVEAVEAGRRSPKNPEPFFALHPGLADAWRLDHEDHEPGLRKALDLVHASMEEIREKRRRAKAIGHDRKVHAFSEQIGALYDLGARIAEEIDGLHTDVGAADEREA